MTERIIELLQGADMGLRHRGSGRSTGAGAAPVGRYSGQRTAALTVAVVTKPFSFEGTRRMRQADKSLAELAGTVDSGHRDSHDRLLELVHARTSVFEAFRVADDILRQAVQGIATLYDARTDQSRFLDIRASCWAWATP